MTNLKFFIYFGEKSGGLGDQLCRFLYLYTFITKILKLDYVCYNGLIMQHSEEDFNNFFGLNNIFSNIKKDDIDVEELNIIDYKEYKIEERLDKIKEKIKTTKKVIKFNCYNFYENVYNFFNISINFVDVNDTKSLIKSSFYELNKERIKNNNNVIIHARREDLTYFIYYNKKYYVFDFMMRNLAEKDGECNALEWIKEKKKKQRVLLTDTIENICNILTNKGIKNITIMTDGFKNLYKNFSNKLDKCYIVDLEKEEIEEIETPEEVKNIIKNNNEFVEFLKKYDNLQVISNNTTNEDLLNLINSKLVIGSSSLFISTAKNYFNFNSTKYITHNIYEDSKIFYDKINKINK